ncbi:MAG: hypothetical protein IJ235_04025 [Eubacterium sp.]|nr:hypothetical protein [Eubacterium sp.]MBQ8980551.1 hypothetical protein [Eubacterium sp.]MBR1532115.1 hypothetical protein [Eubacterium sp.]
MADVPIIKQNASRTNETVCIDTKRIFDSCVSKDCAEDLRVTFYGGSQDIIDRAETIKTRDCDIAAVSIDVEDVPFNRGYYSVDINFYFKLRFDVYGSPFANPQTVVGFANFEKKCILFGSEGDVKVFTSTMNPDNNRLDRPESPQYANPTAKVQAVDPVVLDTDVIDIHHCRRPLFTAFPDSVRDLVDDVNFRPNPRKAVLVTLGLFSIVQMERDTQILINALDYCIPDRECACDTQDPCSTFQDIDFPVDDFFPLERDEIQQ